MSRYVPVPPEPRRVAPGELTREAQRSRRKREVRGRTVSVKNITKRDLALGAALYPEDPTALRPVVRAECEGGHRPCPFVSCRYNLFLDVTPKTGAIKFNFPDLEPGDLETSCALDIADAGGATLEDVGAMMNVTRERVRQLEVKALAKLERRVEKLREFADPGSVGRRRLPFLEAST